MTKVKCFGGRNSGAFSLISFPSPISSLFSQQFSSRSTRLLVGQTRKYTEIGCRRNTYLLKLGRVINVKSPGNHWHAHAHYSPYFQIKPVIDQSYNIQPLFFNIKEFSIRIRFPPEFESIRSPVWWNENWLRTTQTAAGTESYSITLKPKSKGWML